MHGPQSICRIITFRVLQEEKRAQTAPGEGGLHKETPERLHALHEA